ncbi:cationic trypsin-3-like isoform X2 [Photinus pyralis]|nr:cationic trypsin-3-like isoform X2 [Photinus pyralis]XP_031335039.1 cationic trypsin-3-like isoform X2 [Photinus pyralis]
MYVWGGLYPPMIISVVAGQIDHEIRNDSIVRNASRLILHEDFVLQTYFNDIALIELNEELPIDHKRVSTIPLNANSLSSGKCTVSGWGVIVDGSTQVSKTLMVASVDIVEFTQCQKMYSSYEGVLRVLDGMMCAGHVNGETDSCAGDSGGPMVCDGLLTGIVCAGGNCGSSRFPGVYVDVSQYMSWVQEKVFGPSTTESELTTTRSLTSSSQGVWSSVTSSGFEYSTALSTIATNGSDPTHWTHFPSTTTKRVPHLNKQNTGNGASCNSSVFHIYYYLLFMLFVYFCN